MFQLNLVHCLQENTTVTVNVAVARRDDLQSRTGLISTSTDIQGARVSLQVYRQRHTATSRSVPLVKTTTRRKPTFWRRLVALLTARRHPLVTLQRHATRRRVVIHRTAHPPQAHTDHHLRARIVHRHQASDDHRRPEATGHHPRPHHTTVLHRQSVIVHHHHLAIVHHRLQSRTTATLPQNSCIAEKGYPIRV